MSRFRKLFCILCVIAILFSARPSISAAEIAPSVSAHSAIVIEAEHGTVLWEKNADLPLPIASTTKIMTALVVSEKLSPDVAVKIPPEAVGVEGSSVYLVEGERLTVKELLYALLLESANDAAVALAIAACGSVPSFAEEMNHKAEELRLEKTHFQNPHGLPSEDHYATAHDLAVITQAALKNKLLAEIVATEKATIPHGGKEGVRLLINHNKLLQLYEGAVGVKTGFTKKSGRCLVSAAERGGVKLIAVTLNAPDDWKDHAAMLDYGFSQIISTVLCRGHEGLMLIPVVNATASHVAVSNAESLSASLPKGHPPVKQIVEAPRFLYAPVKAGDEVGRLVFQCDLNGDGRAETIGAVPLTVQSDVAQKQKISLWRRILSLLGLLRS